MHGLQVTVTKGTTEDEWYGMTGFVCREHHVPVSPRGKGCGWCASDVRAWRKRRAEKRALAAVKAALRVGRR